MAFDSGPARIAAGLADDDPMTTRVTRLNNGVRVVTDAMPHLQSASVGTWIDAGARYETAEQNGISHLLEHMLFKGTARRSARAIAEEIEDVGGHMNAYTSRDHTTYYAKVLTQDVPLAVDILADILQNSRFDPVELEREQEVIVQEIGQVEDTPDDIVFDYLQERAFPDQPLGRSILGTEEQVESFDRQMLVEYLEAHYRGGNLVVTGAGNVDHDALVRLVEQGFGDLPAERRHGFAPARYEGGDKRFERDTEQLHITLGLPSLAFDDPDYYALQVFSTMLGGGMSSRLFQEVRENRGLAYSVYSFTSCHADTGLFGIYAGTGPEAAGELVEVMARETKGMCEAAPDAEVARARAQLKAGLLMSLESTSSRIEQLGRQMLIFDRILSIEEMVEQVEAVDGAAITRVCERMLSGPLTVATVGRSGTLPDYDRLETLFS